jgi:tetratricopeptide (TPR) repeat protein
MTDPTPPAEHDVRDPAPPGDREGDLLLAGVHLRLGLLALARAELETLAGRDALDGSGLVDLAEARWRTGDIVGAGEAAAAVLDQDGGGPLVALVVAAEAALSRGRPSEARGYATRAMEQADVAIDAIFAGMPRGPMWPADATTLTQPAPTLFEGPRARGVQDVAKAGATEDAGPQDAPMSRSEPATPEPSTMALWGTEDLAAPAGTEAADVPADAHVGLPAGRDLLRTGREALDAGDPATAAAHFGLALRLAPDLAPAILDATDGWTEAGLALVRGDAYRLVGRDDAARRAFAEAIQPPETTSPPTQDPPPPPEGDPA